jgi:hypothetical protein
MGRIPTCQCPRWEQPCSADVTAEDLRCDRCRGDRCQRLVVGPPEEPAAIFRHALIELEVA